MTTTLPAPASRLLPWVPRLLFMIGVVIGLGLLGAGRAHAEGPASDPSAATGATSGILTRTLGGVTHTVTDVTHTVSSATTAVDDSTDAVRHTTTAVTHTTTAVTHTATTIHTKAEAPRARSAMPDRTAQHAPATSSVHRTRVTQVHREAAPHRTPAPQGDASAPAVGSLVGTVDRLAAGTVARPVGTVRSLGADAVVTTATEALPVPALHPLTAAAGAGTSSLLDTVEGTVDPTTTALTRPALTRVIGPALGAVSAPAAIAVDPVLQHLTVPRTMHLDDLGAALLTSLPDAGTAATIVEPPAPRHGLSTPTEPQPLRSSPVVAPGFPHGYQSVTVPAQAGFGVGAGAGSAAAGLGATGGGSATSAAIVTDQDVLVRIEPSRTRQTRSDQRPLHRPDRPGCSPD